MDLNNSKNDDLLKTLTKMTQNNWSKLGKGEKQKTIIDFVTMFQKKSGEKTREIQFIKGFSEINVFDLSNEKTIYIHQNILGKDSNQMEIIFKYFFIYKRTQIEKSIDNNFGKENHELSLDEKLLISNKDESILGLWTNYVGHNSPKYIDQPIIKVAVEYANEETFKIVKIMAKNFNIDVKMSEFIATNMHKSDNKENENEYIKIIEENKNKMFIEKELKDLALGYIAKGVGNLNNQQLFSLFNKSYMNIFTDEEEVKIANEFIKRISKVQEGEEPIVVVDNKGCFYIDNLKIEKNSWQHSKAYCLSKAVVDNDLKDMNALKQMVKNSNLFNDLKLNLYNDGTVNINMFDIEKDPIKYYVQPINLFARKRMRAISNEIDLSIKKECPHEEYRNVPFKMYDDRVIMKKVELIANEPFKNIYENLMKEMENKVLKVETSKNNNSRGDLNV